VGLAFFVTALIICSVFAVTVRAGQATSVKGHQVAIAPAPRHDISGTWEPANGPADGIQPIGVKAMPADGKPEHELPYTPLGLATFDSHKAQEGVNQVLSASNNDPRDKCEPLGFPRVDFLGLRQTQIMEDKYKVAILYENGETWRVIWIDGRELPKVVDGAVMVGNEFREQRYYGYSVGKWVDDTTLVVQTVGTMGDDRIWMDSAGRPVSDALRVEERFHRVDHDHLELTATIDDPKMYTRPWVAMKKDDRDQAVHWIAETSNPADMVNHGWNKLSLKPGDLVTITLEPAKNGLPIGRVLEVVAANGQKLGGGFADVLGGGQGGSNAGATDASKSRDTPKQ
jgi:hypothetical protein